MIPFIDEKPFFSPDQLLRTSKACVPETCIVTWQSAFFEYVSKLDCKKVYSFIGGIVTEVYKFHYQDKELGFASIAMGGPFIAAFLEEMSVLGCKNFVFIGSCGVLSDKVGTKMIVPDKAFRDEGTSWHYIESKDDFIDVISSAKTSTVLEKLGVPFVCGHTWTTDAVFRETRTAIEMMKEKGCLCVEMECASIMAVAQYKKLNASQVLFTADRLDEKDWKIGDLKYKNKKAMENYFDVALAIALDF